MLTSPANLKWIVDFRICPTLGVFPLQVHLKFWHVMHATAYFVCDCTYRMLGDWNAPWDFRYRPVRSGSSVLCGYVCACMHAHLFSTWHHRRLHIEERDHGDRVNSTVLGTFLQICAGHIQEKWTDVKNRCEFYHKARPSPFLILTTVT